MRMAMVVEMGTVLYWKVVDSGAVVGAVAGADAGYVAMSIERVEMEGIYIHIYPLYIYV